ncbi:MAG: tetratricopeptide repeat protein [Phycisphaerales bacterium]
MNAKTTPSRFRAASAAMACVLLAGSLVGCASTGARQMSMGGPGSSEDLNAAVALVAQAQQAQKREKNNEAIALYQQAVQAYNDFPAAWNNMGVLMLKEQRYLEAAECFANAQELAPQDPRPAFNLGLTWDKAGYPSDALSHYQTALQRDPKYLPALRGAARASWLLRRYTESSLDVVRTALAVEREDRWREWFELENVRIQNELSRPTFSGVGGSFNTP